MSTTKINKAVKILTVATLGVLLIACGGKKTLHLSADVGFINASSLPGSAANINAIRLMALQETAMALGAKGALAWRATHINESLTAQASSLDQTYDFNQLLLKNNVLPPVIVEANNDVNLPNNDTLHLANKVYKIISPARFVTTPPTWRTYLWLGFKKPELPSQGLLPKTKLEANVWNAYLKKGWEIGLIQANSIFSVNLNRLKQNFAGMVLYKKLLAQKIVNAPTVAKANMGITGNKKEIRVNDVVMRITNHSSLDRHSQHWEPFLTKD